jgi:hypothetical protein
VVSKTYYVYTQNAQGERTEITERCASPEASYGDAGNERTITVTNANGTGEAGEGQTKSVISPDGRLDTYTYEFGVYSYGAPGVFIPGTGGVAGRP